jgi:hypothetical protein
MTRIVRLTITLAAIAIASVTTNAQSASPQINAIRTAVNHYFQGHATGDGSHFAKVFHPDAKLYWIGPDGTVMQRTSAEYIKGASGKPAADEAQRKRRIVSVDITGNIAMVKVELDYPAVKFTDIFSMVESKGQWWIVNKTYYADRK